MGESLPESSLILNEVTVRNLQLPDSVKMTKKSLVRWIALASGLINPKESRRTSLDVLEVLFEFQMKDRIDPTVEEIMGALKAADPAYGEREKAVRYHLTQLKDRGFLDSEGGKWFFKIPSTGQKWDVAFSFESALRSDFETGAQKLKDAIRALSDLYAQK